MKPAHRGLKIYAALTWDRGFELLHRAQRHTNPIDPRPRLDASAYLGRARRHADQLSWNWIRVVHTLRWCRGDSSTAPNQPPRHGGHDGPKHRNRAGRSHIGVRVRNLDRALGFYRVLGFTVVRRAEGDDVAIIRNEHGVELNLVFNANAGDPATNILTDVRDKYRGYTHIALRVASIPETFAAPNENGIPIAQGPVSFGESGQISVFVRDPDRNVIELRGREQGVVEGVTRYAP